MAFKVDLSEVTSMARKIETTSNVLEKDLHHVTQAAEELITLDSFKGSTASNAKKYLETVHQTAIQSIQLIANQLASNIQMHIDTFNENVDNSASAKVEYNYLQEVKEDIQTHHADIEDSVQNIATTMHKISDIISIDSPSLSDMQASKNNADQTIDQLTNNIELFSEKGTDQDEEMKEMLHHLETLIAEASTNTGEARFANVLSSSIVQPLSYLDEANQLLENRQEAKRKEARSEQRQEAFNQMSEMMESSTRGVKYEKKPSTIVEITQVLLDIVKGTTSGVYHLAEDFVLGTIQMLGDIPGTLEALGSMIAQPIDTVKYIGNVVINSFNRDVIHGDAESRAHWFTYAAGSVFGFKGLGNVGKAGATAARKGAQRAGQKLDELLPYHPKHQLAFDGPVPYNVYDGNFFKEQLIVKVENVSSQEKSLRAGDMISGKGTNKKTYQHLKNYKNNKYFTRCVEYNAGKDGIGFTYKVYQRGDMNWDMVRTKGAKKGRGLTNAEASAKYGLAPILDDAGSVATLHHSQQKGVGPLYEASTRYHNISNAKRAPLHPYKGKLNPFYPMDETTRGAFQKVDSINYWKIRGEEALGGK